MKYQGESNLPEPTYIIGIDLGTTNSVVAYADAKTAPGNPPEIRIFPIPQTVGPGTVEKRDILPSFLMVPGPQKEPVGFADLAWDPSRKISVGEYARDRGAELPNSLISSSKSWLCNAMVDREDAILPWEGALAEAKLSPVESSAAILQHLRDAWNKGMAGDNSDLMMEHQQVLLTVPASFDAVARELTVRAAQLAGLANVTLLEEPQAAFYAWIHASGDDWRDRIRVGERILVCDVGGGTCDFSLIRVIDNAGDLGLERVAVGDHLLVGGDNMDLTLAYAVYQQLAEKGTKLDAWQMRGLRHSCREAKEKLLNDGEADTFPLTVLGRGSSLIGGTIKTELTRDQVQRVILDGFLPHCESDARPVKPQAVGIREIGLAYESDPAITHHLAGFLNAQQDNASPDGVLPNAVLFNGGVMKAPRMRQRIMQVFNGWQQDQNGTAIRRIDNGDYDLAVARGAVYYGLARQGKGIRIRSGLGQTYYLGVAASMPAVPGMPTPIKALCVAPFGMEEGSSAAVPNQEFVLTVGEPAGFDFLGSTVRHKDAVGAIVEDWESEILPITNLETTLDGDTGSTVPVILEVNITEVGTLELWCVSRSDGRKWKLEFNVREKES
jgi:molecular chaperone DnaK (HSP70)